MGTESVRTIAPFWGVKSAALTFYSTPQTVAKLTRVPMFTCQPSRSSDVKCKTRAFCAGNVKIIQNFEL